MHEKHPKLPRPTQGHYARTELAFVGSTCERMEALMSEWMGALSPQHRCLLVTGEHGDSAVEATARVGRKRFSTNRAAWNDYDDRLVGREYDLALVNGNHYPAAKQIVFVDPAKAGTLERRKDQLTDIFALINVDGSTPIPEWLQEHCSRQHRPPVATTLSMLDVVLAALRQLLHANTPPLHALILAGGRSTRMGTDKSSLVYREGKTELQRLHELCMACHLPTRISVREDEIADYPAPTVADRFLGLGPAGAICSAFMQHPDVAWLVLACDLPLMDRATLERLVAARDFSATATAVRGPGREWPEPLVAIYEPRAYPRLLQFLGLGYSCPRKMLINSPTKLVDLETMTPLTNANTPEERDRVLGRIGREN